MTLDVRQNLKHLPADGGWPAAKVPPFARRRCFDQLRVKNQQRSWSSLPPPPTTTKARDRHEWRRGAAATAMDGGSAENAGAFFGLRPNNFRG